MYKFGNMMDLYAVYCNFLLSLNLMKMLSNSPAGRASVRVSDERRPAILAWEEEAAVLLPVDDHFFLKQVQDWQIQRGPGNGGVLTQRKELLNARN